MTMVRLEEINVVAYESKGEIWLNPRSIVSVYEPNAPSSAVAIECTNGHTIFVRGKVREIVDRIDVAMLD